MYIANPLKKKGRKLNDLSSTHPPISERIRILRSIAQSTDFNAYQSAFNKVTGKESNVFPASELKQSEPINIKDVAGIPGLGLTQKQTQRNIGDLIMKLNDYSFINCPCGVKIKIPPDYKKKNVSCPRCGRMHQIK